MKRSLLLLALAPLVIVSSSSAESRVERRFKAMLKRLDPETRLYQVCDFEAMKRIDRDRKKFRPDRAMSDAVAPSKISGNTISGKGGAFRSRGQWYQFSFTCKASKDRMKVLNYQYKIGGKIPKNKWEDYGLWR